jgi:hypothetical protein
MAAGMKKPTTTMQGAPIFPRGMTVSTVHFQVHPGLPEVQEVAQANGWHAVSIQTEELRYTTDGWKTEKVVRSSDQPPPMAPDGRIYLAGVGQGTEVEFALRLTVVPVDSGGGAVPAEVWLNSGGKNFRQVTK